MANPEKVGQGPTAKDSLGVGDRDAEYMPPLRHAIPLGLQHVLAMFAGNITVPIIIAGVIGASPDEKVFLIQAAMLVAGIATLIQTVGIGRVGARLPIVQGTSFGFLPVAIPIAKSFGLAAVLGGALVAGLIQVALGAMLGRIRHWFPPLVTGIVVLAIGIALLPVGIKYAAGGVKATDFGAAHHLGMAVFVILLTLVLKFFCKGLVSAAAVFIAIVAGYAVAYPFGMVSFGNVESAAWFAVPTPLQFGLEFPAAAIIGMGVMAFVTTIETVGDISGITMGGAGRDATDKETSGGIMADGIGTSIAAVLNALPNTSYSQNVGLVALTGVMSRHVVSIGAVVLVLAGLVPKLGAVVASIPNAVLGGAAIIMFGMVAAAGLKLIASAELNRRNLVIIALSLGVGLGLQAVPDAVMILPQQIKLLLVSGIIPAAFLAVILNAVLPVEESP